MNPQRDKTVTADALLAPASERPRGAHLVEVLREASLPNVLADEIERLILSGQLLPGDRINELQLAQHYGVSRGPLRAALGTLTAQGLLEQIKNRGSFVRLVGAKEAGEIYELRGILELASVDAFGARDARARAPILERFAVILEEMTQAVRAADEKRYFGLNLSFHETLVSAHGNHKLIQTYRGLVRDLVLVRRQNLRSAASLMHSLEEHHNIVLALRENQLECARARLSAHIAQGRRRAEHDEDHT